MKARNITWTGAILAAGLLLPSSRAAADEYAVQVVIQGVSALAPFDRDSQADFFAEMNIGGVPYRSDAVFDRDRVAPGWQHFATFSYEQLLLAETVDIDIGLRETNDRFGETGRLVDIAGRRGVFDLSYELQFDPRGGAVILLDAHTGRAVRQLVPVPGGASWTTGRMISSGPHARIAFEVNVVRLPRYRF